MATVSKIRRIGNLLQIINSDGSRQFAYPSGTTIWMVGAGGAPTSFKWPFDPSSATTYPGHRGLDFPEAGGTPIPSIGDGIVSHSVGGGIDYDPSSNGGWGNYVRVDHGIVDGANIVSAYAHMNATPIVDVDDVITLGQTLGYVGTTGNSTGNHLHLEIWYNGVRLVDDDVTDWMNDHATWP